MSFLTTCKVSIRNLDTVNLAMVVWFEARANFAPAASKNIQKWPKNNPLLPRFSLHLWHTPYVRLMICFTSLESIDCLTDVTVEIWHFFSLYLGDVVNFTHILRAPFLTISFRQKVQLQAVRTEKMCIKLLHKKGSP